MREAEKIRCYNASIMLSCVSISLTGRVLSELREELVGGVNRQECRSGGGLDRCRRECTVGDKPPDRCRRVLLPMSVTTVTVAGVCIGHSDPSIRYSD